ncbi:MAG TPA: sulfotransferase domain-containing protein [Polyangiaceae bacterium]
MIDSTLWNGFEIRDDDVIIAAPPKGGTTWIQQIVGQLLSGGREGYVAGESDWLEMVSQHDSRPELRAQKSRRSLKTHLPVDALAFHGNASYIYVARDIRDMVWSAHNHFSSFTEAKLAAINRPDLDYPRFAPITVDVRTYYNEFMAGDGTYFPGNFSIWDQVGSWWHIRHLPNVLFVHYNTLKADLPRQIRRIARHIRTPIDDAMLPRLVEHCHIDYMRKAAGDSEFSRIFERAFTNGVGTFFNKGTNGRWKDMLSAEEIAKADEVAGRQLPAACAHWLRTGEMPDGERDAADA